jgi:phosphatidate cytidylyltransferase
MNQNTKLRIISALVILFVLGGLAALGPLYVKLFCGFCGFFVTEEIWTNFFKKTKNNFFYGMEVFFITAFISLISIGPFYIKDAILFLGLMLSLVQIFFLFFVTLDRSKEIFEKYFQSSFLTALTSLSLGLVPALSLTLIIEGESWKEIVLILIAVNYGMDTGAWFFGKNFGKHKLSPVVSPNKTVEGLIGGFCTSGLLGTLFWYLVFDQFSWSFLPLFAFIGIFGQLGDLIQSKYKRMVGLKDSSQRIPGHGGIYDRVDSLFFVSAIYAILIRNLL